MTKKKTAFDCNFPTRPSDLVDYKIIKPTENPNATDTKMVTKLKLQYTEKVNLKSN